MRNGFDRNGLAGVSPLRYCVRMFYSEGTPSRDAIPVSRCDVVAPRSPIEIGIVPLWASRVDEDAVERSRRSRAHTPVSRSHNAFLDIDAAALSSDEALDALVAVQEHASRLAAIEAELLVRAAGATRVVRDVLVEDTDPRSGLPVPGRAPRTLSFTDEVVDEIACALHRPVAVVQSQLHTARMLHGPLRRTRDELRAGRITLGHASAISDQASRLAAAPLGVDPDADLVLAAACDVLQDRVLPHAPSETVTECRSRAGRAVTSIDPAGAAARRRRAKLRCDVTGRALDDGLALIEAVLPALDAAAVLARVDADARHAVSSGEVEQYGLGCDPTLGQVRAAVFAHLVRGGGLSATAAGARVEVGVLVDAAILAGLAPNGPVCVSIAGQPVDASRDDLLQLLGAPGVHASFRRLVCDPLTGALIDRGANSYVATAALRAWLAARDQRCTSPGCTRPARRCDVDHAVDFHDGGRTTVADTRLLCRRHHNAKTHLGWTVANQAADGSYDLTSPAGRHYRHEPVRLLPEPPPPADPDPDPPPDNDEVPPF